MYAAVYSTRYDGEVATRKRGGKTRFSKPGDGDRGQSIRLVFDHLRELILTGKMAPGTWIVESELAERTGYSRTPVRGALLWLQREGYVVSTSQSTKARLVVAPLTVEDARELYTLIGHIEALGARLTAQLPHAARMHAVRQLREYNNTLSELAYATKPDANAVFDLDLSFHRALMEASAGARLLQLHRNTQPQAERYWRLYAHAILDDLAKSAAEHESVVRALNDGDAKAAESFIQENWENGAKRLTRVMESLGERGSW